MQRQGVGHGLPADQLVSLLLLPLDPKAAGEPLVQALVAGGLAFEQQDGTLIEHGRIVGVRDLGREDLGRLHGTTVRFQGRVGPSQTGRCPCQQNGIGSGQGDNDNAEARQDSSGPSLHVPTPSGRVE